jgi:hypothetical protein
VRSLWVNRKYDTSAQPHKSSEVVAKIRFQQCSQSIIAPRLFGFPSMILVADFLKTAIFVVKQSDTAPNRYFYIKDKGKVAHVQYIYI